MPMPPTVQQAPIVLMAYFSVIVPQSAERCYSKICICVCKQALLQIIIFSITHPLALAVTIYILFPSCSFYISACIYFLIIAQLTLHPPSLSCNYLSLSLLSRPRLCGRILWLSDTLIYLLYSATSLKLTSIA